MPEKYTIIRDTQEKDNHGWIFHPDVNCYGTEEFKLKTGDYTIKGLEDIFTIERKSSTAEIAMNIYQPRFERELERLEQLKYPIIICEFEFNDILIFPHNSGIPQNKWHKLRTTGNYLFGRIMDYQVRFKTRWIFAGDDSMNAATSIFKQVARNERIIK